MARTSTRTKTFRKGDRVEWSSHGGKKKRRGVAVGTVLKKLTSPRSIKGHEVKASADDPQYLVRSDNGGKAAHKPGALRRSTRKAATASTKADKAGRKSATKADRKKTKKTKKTKAAKTEKARAKKTTGRAKKR